MVHVNGWNEIPKTPIGVGAKMLNGKQQPYRRDGLKGFIHHVMNHAAQSALLMRPTLDPLPWRLSGNRVLGAALAEAWQEKIGCIL